MFSTVLIANRGEIAVRITRTLRRMGVSVVAVYDAEDRKSLHVQVADVALRLKGGYLDGAEIIEAARKSGAEAIHPGYGFLAENADFAQACADAGICFVGPSASAIQLMGDKINAKRAVSAVGVPVVPGRDEAGLDDAELAQAALVIGLPVLLKPSAGGGGKGMRLVTDEADLAPSIAAARREARGAFGNDTLLVEQFVANPRHIEMQVFADSQGNVVSLGERECSLQRRHQKIVEEAPSPFLEPATRAAMAASAVAVAQACRYVGAGTVEFIVSADHPDEYFFMEMNTRLQVEHAVTEMVLGIDLVEWQLRVAAGEPIPWVGAGAIPEVNGHAIEARIYAEDATRGFLPSSGTVLLLHQPRTGRRLRIDSGLQEGTLVGTRYDPMLAKLVAWGQTRPEALANLADALSQTSILGVTTNVTFLRRLIEHPQVQAGRLDTGLVERIAPQLDPGRTPDEALAAAALLERQLALLAGRQGDPWAIGDGWRPAGPAPVTTTWRTSEDRTVLVRVLDDRVSVDGQAWMEATGRIEADGELLVEADGIAASCTWAVAGDDYWLAAGGDTWKLQLIVNTLDRARTTLVGRGQVTSPMPGTVLSVGVSEGEHVAAGHPLVTVEAMKMEHVVTAPISGTVGRIMVHAGAAVALDQPLVTIEADPRPEP